MRLGTVLLVLASLCVAEALSPAPRDFLGEAAEEEKLAIRAFSDAVPFVEGVVADIYRLQRSLRNAESFLQIGSQPAKQTGNKTALAKVVGREGGAEPAAKPAAPVGAKKALLANKAAKKDGFDTQKAVQSMKNMGAAQMPAMLGLMKGMYASWKNKISVANKNEEDQKKTLLVEIAKLEEKKRDRRYDANATKWYDSMESYWKKQRALSHRQYHTSLKLMHAGMEKMKTMIGAMGDAVAGKKPTKQELASLGAMMPPDVVLLLQRQTKQLAAWAKGASATLRDARNPHPGMKYAKVCQADEPSG